MDLPRQKVNEDGVDRRRGNASNGRDELAANELAFAQKCRDPQGRLVSIMLMHIRTLTL